MNTKKAAIKKSLFFVHVCVHTSVSIPRTSFLLSFCVAGSFVSFVSGCVVLVVSATFDCLIHTDHISYISYIVHLSTCVYIVKLYVCVHVCVTVVSQLCHHKCTWYTCVRLIVVHVCVHTCMYDWIHERIDQSIHIGSRGLI
jgi:hypothetical protein